MLTINSFPGRIPLLENALQVGCCTIKSMTTEELYLGLSRGELSEDAFSELFRRLRKLVIIMSRGYMGSMSMDENDMCQEAMILLWKIIMKNNYSCGTGNFTSYYSQSWKYRLRHMWQNFVINNPVPIHYEWDWHYREPAGDCVLEWSDDAERYRIQKRIRQERWQKKKQASRISREAA